eukprot:gene22653-29803_t
MAGQGADGDNTALHGMAEQFTEDDNTALHGVAGQGADGDNTALHSMAEQFTEDDNTALHGMAGQGADGDNTALHGMAEQFTEDDNTALHGVAGQGADGDNTALHSMAEQFTEDDNTALHGMAGQGADGDSTALNGMAEQFKEDDKTALQGMAGQGADGDNTALHGMAEQFTEDDKTALHGMAGQGADDDKRHSASGGVQTQTDSAQHAGNTGKSQAPQQLPFSGPSNGAYLSLPEPSACLQLNASEQGAQSPGPLSKLNGILYAARGPKPPQRPMHQMDSFMPPRFDQCSNIPNEPMQVVVAEPLKLQPSIKLPGHDFGIHHPHGAPRGARSETFQGRMAGDLPPAATHHSDSETAMWDMIAQIKRKLPPGAVLDCVVPDSKARVLGLLYREGETCNYRSRGGSTMCAAIWQQNNLLGRMSCRSSVEARSSLDNMMELAASFRNSEKRPLDHYQGQPQGVAVGPQQSRMMEVPPGRERVGPHWVPVNPSDVRGYPGSLYTSSAYLHPMAMPEMAVRHHHTGQDTSGVRIEGAPIGGTVPRFVTHSNGVNSFNYQQQQSSQLDFGAHSSVHMQQRTPQVQLASSPHHVLCSASDPRGNRGEYIMQVPNSAPQQQILYNHNLVSIPRSALPNHMYSSPMQ